MSRYREYSQTIEIPKNTGTRGFLRALEEILKLSLVQSVQIDARGQVTYKRYVPSTDEDFDIRPQLQLDELMPYAVLRNGRIDELPVPAGATASVTLVTMCNEIAKWRLYPTAFVTGANTTLFTWVQTTSGLTLFDQETILGIPVLRDRLVEDYVLLLAGAYERAAPLQDTQRTVKITMPQHVEDDVFKRMGNPE